jgi:integrase
VRFKLAAYVDEAAKAVPSLRSKHVTPHSFRHATAVHLVAAGVDSPSSAVGSGTSASTRPTTMLRPIWRPSERRWNRWAPAASNVHLRGNGMPA